MPAHAASPAIEATDLVKEYPEAEGCPPRRVLDGVSLTVHREESLAIVGPSGCGKSTLLNLLGLLDTPTSGTVMIHGQATAGLSPERLAHLRAENLGFVFQLHHLLPQCTVLENVLVPTLALPKKADKRVGAEERARRLLEAVGLAPHAAKFPGQLSGGERQRVAVIRALINQPQVVLADEPTGALDQKNALDVRDLLKNLCRDTQAALIVVTHDDNVAEHLDRTLQLS